MQLQLDARMRALLRRLPRTNVYSALELLLLAALAAQCARLLWAIVTPVGPIGDWRPAQANFAGSPAAILRGFDPFFRSGATTNGQPTIVTSLQITLYGIRINEASGGGSAIVAGPDGLQQSVAVGGEVMPGVKLKSVAFDHVTLDRGGTEEDLFLDQSGAVDPVAPTPATTSVAPTIPVPTPATAKPGAGISVKDLQSGIGFIPRLDAGKISGLVVRPNGSGDVFRKAGLQEGDIITAIGGRAVTGQGDIERVVSQMSGGGNLSITVERGAQTLPLVITIAAP